MRINVYPVLVFASGKLVVFKWCDENNPNAVLRCNEHYFLFTGAVCIDKIVFSFSFRRLILHPSINLLHKNKLEIAYAPWLRIYFELCQLSGVILDILPIIVYSYHTKLKPKNKHFITIFIIIQTSRRCHPFCLFPICIPKPRIKRPELSALCLRWWMMFAVSSTALFETSTTWQPIRSTIFSKYSSSSLILLILA